MILHHWTHRDTHVSPATHTRNLTAKGIKLLEEEQAAAEELIGYLESAVTDSLEQRGISRTSYEAGQEWAVPVQFCQLHRLPITSVYPAHCAADGHWINFLLFVQLHSYPPQQVRLLATQFGPALQAHLSLAFQELQFSSHQRSGLRDEEDEAQEENVKQGHDPEEPPRELFQVLLRSQEEPRSWTNLLGEALAQRCPLLAILAACHQEAELLQCLCAWVLSSVDDVTAAEATAHLEESQCHHCWNLHDLSIIWRSLLGRGHVRPLLRGFQLFQKDCVLVHVLQMFELCSDHKNFSQARNKLLDFQRSLVALRSSVCIPPGGLPVQWVESQASVLLTTMLQRCATRYELHRLLLLLAGMDGLLKSNGPDFKKLSQLSEVLQTGPVCVSSRLLQPCSQQELQTEYQGLVDSLQAAGLFPQARQVAELADLPVDVLLITQLQQELITQKAKRQWGRREARVCFWRRCHEQFETNGTSPELPAMFFGTYLEEDDASPQDSSTQTELLRTQERCVLLSLSGHWVSRVDPVPLRRLRILEKCLWANRIRERVLLRVSMETESMFTLPFSPLTSVGSEESDDSTFSSLSSWYEVLVNEQFCFSKISALNQESDLTLDGLPQDAAANRDSAESPEEQDVLSELIGQLLDEGRVHEASRVCGYFNHYHSDLHVVLRCRGLASGELRPDGPEETKATLEKAPSISSLLSFDMVPLPDDQVLCHLKTLVNNCRHGSNYCKQVLSLYELSKELGCSFNDLYKEDPQTVLSQVLMSSQPERYQKAQAFIKVQNLQPNTVAQMVAKATVQGILATTQDSVTAEKQVYRPSEGRDSFVQLAKLCGDPNLVGLRLLDLLSTVPLSKLDCIVEVLIVVHDCFSLSCNMEGIVRVLQAARHLSHAHLAPSEQYGLLVRLLTGIGRYNEMTYIFDLLHQNHRFEILLRKNVDRPPGQSSSLKAALLDYIKRCLPGDSEKHNMVALCFSMRREIGENHEMAARTQLKIIESQPWVVTPEMEKSLSKVFDLLKDAAESYSKDQCVRQAARCVRMAKLVMLQRHFLKEGSQQRIINLRQADLPAATLSLPRCYQVFVVSEAYDYSPDWAELVYQKVLVNGDFQYLEELKRHRPLTPSLFEDVSKKWTLNRPAGSSTQNLRGFLRFCDDVYTLYRLAYQHQLTDLANQLLQDNKSNSYLTDRLTLLNWLVK